MTILLITRGKYDFHHQLKPLCTEKQPAYINLILTILKQEKNSNNFENSIHQVYHILVSTSIKLKSMVLTQYTINLSHFDLSTLPKFIPRLHRVSGIY